VKYYALFCDVVDDFVARRAAFRGERLRLAQVAHDRGELVPAGALADPVDRAMLVVVVPEWAVVDAFVGNDPYVTNGSVVGDGVPP
jgi:hypothetical protein